MSLIHLVAWGEYDLNLTENSPEPNSDFIINHKKYINFDILLKKIVKCKKILDCSICLTNQSDIITDCKHQYCKSCLDTWMNEKNKDSCPYCRNSISSINIFKMKKNKK